MMADSTVEFARQLRDAPTDKISERVVRGMVKSVVADCSVALVVQLGQVILDYRLAEIRDQAERN